MDEYTENVTNIRIHDEGDGWAIDGANHQTDEYTEKVWKYNTPEEALAAVEEFVKDLIEDEVTVQVRDGRVSVNVYFIENHQIPVKL